MIQLRLAAVCILQGVEPQHIVRIIRQTADAEGGVGLRGVHIL